MFIRGSSLESLSLKCRTLLATTALGLPGVPAMYAAQAPKRLRVGLIGTGWYGKCSLFRLLQVAPVDVVSLRDVAKKMLAEAADLITQRAKAENKPRLYGDYREMLEEWVSRGSHESPDAWYGGHPA